jgi:hypothetical protein
LATDSFHPDIEWIEAYVKSRAASDTRPRKKLTPPPVPDRNLSTSTRLNELVKLMPPPDKVPSKDLGNRSAGGKRRSCATRQLVS